MEAEIKFRKVKCSHPRRPRHRPHVAQSHFFCVSVIGKRHGASRRRNVDGVDDGAVAAAIAVTSANAVHAAVGNHATPLEGAHEALDLVD